MRNPLSGFVAQVVLTMSMLFGLMMRSCGLDGGVRRSTVLDHHQQWALAAIVFWGMLLLTLSSWLRSYMSFVVWRVVHTLALAAFVLGLVHGMTAGTDSSLPIFQALCVRSGSEIIGATVFHCLHVARRTSPAAPKKPAVGAASS